MATQSESPPRGSNDSSRHSAALAEKSLEEPATEAKVEPTAAAAAPENEYMTTRKFIPVFISLYLAFILVALDRTIISTAIPTITNDFHSLGDLEWYASAYMLTASAFMLIFGRLYGFYSPKYVFIACILIFEIGSAICGAAPNSMAFIWGRAIAGLGGAGAFSGAIVIIMFTVPMHKRPMYTGFLASAFGIASAIGPVAGGGFTSSAATWRWCFYINLPIGGFALIVIFFLLPNLKTTGGGAKKTLREQIANLDPLGTALFIPSIVCLILALQWGGGQYGWNDGRVIATLVVFALGFLAFLVVQWWKGENATVPPRLISMRSIAAAAFYTFCNGSGFMVVVYFLPIWFQAIQGLSAFDSGVRTLPLVLSIVICSIASGIIVRFMGYYVPMMYALSIITSIAAGLLTTLRPDTSQAKWIGYQVLFGGGLGVGMQQGSIAAQTVLAKKDISVGSSLLFFAQQLGGAVFIAVAQNVFDQKLVQGLSAIPGFDIKTIATTGATQLRQNVPPQLLPQVLEVYNGAIVAAFQVALALQCATIIGTLTVEWKSVKQEKKAAEKAAKEKAAAEA